MRKLIKNRSVVEDQWQYLHEIGDGTLAALTGVDAVIVPWAFWQEHRQALEDYAGPLGIEILAEQEPEALVQDLSHFELIAIRFPEFKDGRGYSCARLLRDRFHFEGELRAIGDVLRDQLFYLSRCGFNAFEIRADRSVEDAVKAFADFSVSYQAACDQPLPIYRRRG